MGPSKSIGSSSCRDNTHSKASAAALKENNRPKQGHWQKQLPMQWAHPWALAAPAEKIMGPSEVISSCSCKCNGPILRHWQQLSKKIIGPSEAIGRSSCKCNGPVLGHRQHLLKNQWAQARPSTAATANAMGLSQGDRKSTRLNSSHGYI